MFGLPSHRIRRNYLYRTYMLAKACMAYIRIGRPGKDMTYIGITGTDGKSTTSMCTYHILKTAGYKVGLISTVYIDIGNGIQENTTHLTSPSHTKFREKISQAEKTGCTHMVIEVSSHALYQYRTRPMKFDSVGITNLTREHLDFHRTMEHYAKTKAELFGRLLSSGTAILPVKLPYTHIYQKYQGAGQTWKTFHSVVHGIDQGKDPQYADIYVQDIQEHPQLEFDLYIGGAKVHIYSSQIGSFNIDNMMLAAGIASSVGCDIPNLRLGLESFRGLPGRQELVTADIQGHICTAMIDFALTPDALEILYTSTRKMGFSPLVCIFGATGDRDQGKRPRMGAIASQYCDEVIITEDENYSEDGLSIMKAVEEGLLLDGVMDTSYMIQDRVEAIDFGVQRLWEIVQDNPQAKPILIVTGMANFAYRQMGTEKQSWNEKEVIEQAFEKIQK